MNTRPARAASANPLVNRYFHYFSDGKLEGQGRIVSEISNGHFLVEFFAVDGWPSGQEVLHVARMAHWRFFSSREAMRAAQTGGAA